MKEVCRDRRGVILQSFIRDNLMAQGVSICIDKEYKRNVFIAILQSAEISVTIYIYQSIEMSSLRIYNVYEIAYFLSHPRSSSNFFKSFFQRVLKTQEEEGIFIVIAIRSVVYEECNRVFRESATIQLNFFKLYFSEEE